MDENYLNTNSFPESNWFLSKQDAELLNNEPLDDMKDFFDLVNNDSLINDSDMQDLLSQDGLIYSEDRYEQSLFHQTEDKNRHNFNNNNNDINPDFRKSSLIYDNPNIIDTIHINDHNNFMTQEEFMSEALHCVEPEKHMITSSLATNSLINNKSEKQKQLMEQLLQKFQQDSSSAELVLQLLELAKSTSDKSPKQEKTNAPEKMAIEIKPQITENLQSNLSFIELNSKDNDIQHQMLKIDKRPTKKIQLLAKPLQPKSQIILKNISPGAGISPPQQQPQQKIIVKQINTTNPIQIAPQQQYFIVTSKNQIVSSATTNIQTSSTNLTVEDLQKMPIDRLPVQQQQVFRGERKTTHNAIEKKYRMSINNRLAELRELLDGPDSKLNKSSILRKAIEQIKHLKNANLRLINEVKYLKSLVGQKNPDVASPTMIIDPDFLVDYPTPASSHIDSHSYSSSDDGFPSSPENPIDDSLYLNHAIDPHLVSPPYITNKSQYLLSFFFVIMFVINPIAFLIGNVSANFVLPLGGNQKDEFTISHHAQRSLQSIEDDPMIPTTTHLSSSLWLRWISLWVINLIFTLLVFARITMFSEPVFKTESKIASAFWRALAQADVSIERGDFTDGKSQLVSCLALLGRGQSTGSFSMFISLMWNLLRQFLHRMHIGSWLESKAGDHVWCRTESLGNVKNSARFATLVYIKLLRLNIIENSSKVSRMYSMNLALSTINMAEASEETLPQTILSESYVLLALTMKTILPTFLHSYIQFVLHQTVSELELSPELSWLRTTEGINFIFNQTLDSQDFTSFYTSNSKNKGDALVSMSRLYMEFLEEHILNSIIMAYGLPIAQYKKAMEKLKQYTSLLHKLLQNFHSDKNRDEDEKTEWWCSILQIAILLPDQYQELANKKIHNLPQLLTKFPLAKCIFEILQIKEILSNEHEVDVDAVKKMCRDATEMLKYSFTFKDNSNTRNCITENWQLLASDWLLLYLTDAMQRETEETYCNVDGTIEKMTNYQRCCSHKDLSLFEDLLAILRKLTVNMQVTQAKLSLHETALRLMAGANPVKTLQLFERNLLRQRINVKEKQDTVKEFSEEMSREEACSVLLWLQSSPRQMLNLHQSTTLPHAAISAFERLGDGKSAAMCRKIMLRMNI